jgi:hypothetical protein
MYIIINVVGLIMSNIEFYNTESYEQVRGADAATQPKDRSCEAVITAPCKSERSFRRFRAQNADSINTLMTLQNSFDIEKRIEKLLDPKYIPWNDPDSVISAIRRQLVASRDEYEANPGTYLAQDAVLAMFPACLHPLLSKSEDELSTISDIISNALDAGKFDKATLKQLQDFFSLSSDQIILLGLIDSEDCSFDELRDDLNRGSLSILEMFEFFVEFALEVKTLYNPKTLLADDKNLVEGLHELYEVLLSEDGDLFLESYGYKLCMFFECLDAIFSLDNADVDTINNNKWQELFDKISTLEG